MSQLKLGDPKNTTVLEHAIRFLLTRSNPPLRTLAQIAQCRVRDYAYDSQGFLLWIAVWLQVDASPAIDFLGQILPGNKEGPKIIEQVCSLLSGQRLSSYPLIKEPDFLLPDRLASLIRLVFQFVKTVDDLHRHGAFSPTTRDDAQRFRDGLLERLAQSARPEAGLMLRELLEEPSLNHRRDWILHLIDKHTELLADLPPWSPEEIKTFSENYETDPKTDRELFSIANNRLADLKYDVEFAENSLRSEVRQDDDEGVLRDWVARKLTERSRNRYTLPREEEVGLHWRPDLRFENPKTAPVSIEIKWADKWSLSVLLERLQNQLVGQYLRDHKSRYGIYLLGFIEKKAHWEDPTSGRSLSFVKILDIIQARANTIANERADVEKIAVLGIDFSRPSTKKREPN